MIHFVSEATVESKHLTAVTGSSQCGSVFMCVYNDPYAPLLEQAIHWMGPLS